MGTQPLPTDPRTSAGWIRRDVFESITVDADRVADGTMTLEQFTDRLGWHLTIVDDPHADQDDPAARLEYLRGELRAERISQDELIELADLAPHIDPDDVELLEPAGVPESGPEREAHRRQWNAAHHVATD